jgi:hypothetical protein
MGKARRPVRHAPKPPNPNPAPPPPSSSAAPLELEFKVDRAMLFDALLNPGKAVPIRSGSGLFGKGAGGAGAGAGARGARGAGTRGRPRERNNFHCRMSAANPKARPVPLDLDSARACRASRAPRAPPTKWAHHFRDTRLRNQSRVSRALGRPTPPLLARARRRRPPCREPHDLVPFSRAPPPQSLRTVAPPPPPPPRPQLPTSPPPPPPPPPSPRRARRRPLRRRRPRCARLRT